MATTKRATPPPKPAVKGFDALKARPGRKPSVRSGKKLILTQTLLPGVKYIKVRLNARTIVMLKSMKNFAYWKERYPDAEIIP